MEKHSLLINSTMLILSKTIKYMLTRSISKSKYVPNSFIKNTDDIEFSNIENKLLNWHLPMSSLLRMYVKCDDLARAHEVFEEMCERDAVSSTSLVCGGHINLLSWDKRELKVNELFEEMPK
ncbi:hypothetical protein LguiB_032199 [Lonicera macranthoides]